MGVPYFGFRVVGLIRVLDFGLEWDYLLLLGLIFSKGFDLGWFNHAKKQATQDPPCTLQLWVYGPNLGYIP